MANNKLPKGRTPTVRPGRSLSRKIDFDQLRSHGRKISPNRWLLVIFRANEVGYLRYGLSLTRKVGTAVTRNRLKRWSREFLRRKIKEGKDLAVDTHIIFRPTAQDFYRDLRFADFERDMEVAWDLARKVEGRRAGH